MAIFFQPEMLDFMMDIRFNNNKEFMDSHRDQYEKLMKEPYYRLIEALAPAMQKIDLGTLLFLVPGLGELLYNRLRRDPREAYRSLYPYYSDLDGMPPDPA